jgi:DNA-binding NarL/FixJ family response regulator
MPITLVLADDHPLVLNALDQLFRLESDFSVLATCTTGDETLRAVRLYRPDVLMLDIAMPGKDGFAVLRDVRTERLPTRVVLLTASLTEDDLLEAVRLGARGVVLKEMAPRLIVQCVRKVHAGEQWLEKRSMSRAFAKLLRQEAGARRLAGLLTPRETEIVRMVASGLRNREIADRLHISEGTVKIHLHNIYEKVAVSGRMELMLYARDVGLL